MTSRDLLIIPFWLTLINQSTLNVVC